MHRSHSSRSTCSKTGSSESNYSKDNNKKYTEDVYNLLNNKIKIFFSICWQVDIHKEQFHAVFPRILTRRAEMFYIQVIDRGNSFSNAYTITTTFARTRIENPNKSLYKGVLELKIVLFKLAIICEGLFIDLYTILTTATTIGIEELEEDLEAKADSGNQRFNSNDSKREFTTPRWKKKCFVCQKEGYWLTNHTNEERKAARTQFFSACYFTGTLLPADFSMHLAEYKGSENYEDDNNNSDYKDIYNKDVPSSPASQFLIKDRYTRSVYQGILPNTGAANEDPTVTMDTSTAGKTSIKFGKGSVTVSIGTAQIPTEIGKIDFEVLDAPTPFLLCLADMDRLKVYFNNTTDELIDSAPRRFKFTLKDDYYFNYEILVDVMYLRSKPILHVFLNAILAKETCAEFRAKVKIMGVTCKQMAVKAVNDTAGPNSLVLTLLVFGAYPRMTIESPPSPSMLTTKRQVADALNTRNGPDTADMLALPLQSEVLQQHALPIDIIVPLAKQPRKRGRPLGLRNKRKANVYITKKKKANLKLAIKLYNNRISNLVGHRSRLVRERVIMALAPMLAYLQAQINLKRIILAHLPTKLALRYLEGTLLHVIKPLYGIAEAGVHYNADNFGIVSIQTNNTLMLRTATFLAHKEKMLKKAYYTLIIDAKASFNLSIDIKALNKRLKWQIENLNRGLRYIPITLINAKLILGFILMLVNKSTDSDNTFTIYGNIIHYSLTKCKRVTRSVLASKIYSIIITERLGLPVVPLVICTDSYSLYECLIKLGTTKEKRLIIDIIALRQSYERREIIEI
ncbi:hypothetical protein BU23DRAFT_580957 [Bimuria novae-zelandiae CBS 107.79]|uniref:Reverse transcriptase domain-containing protein n=1 Tax=Bimuria novae-zelandiae CBS 107.79 TaxID=1447943 RepID=A0A6A5V546_9PLEO|nr:hypothetical protein BU23DRAFT_580957 [Bimuria novae-zelandiae CBS 107.79]